MSKLEMVIYTDGGCNPNPGGPCGWGFHGYVYSSDVLTDTISKKIDVPTNLGYINGNQVEDARNEIWASAHTTKLPELKGCKPEINVDGWGPIYADVVGADKTTNNIAELVAATRGVQLAIKKEVSRVHLILDSEYTLGITKAAQSWKRNGWLKSDMTEPKNLELWKTLDAVVEEAKARGIEISWQWTKGHADNIGNKRADLNATRGIKLYKLNRMSEVFEEFPFNKYIAGDSRPSRFFGHGSWYFYTHLGEVPKTDDGRFIYFCGVHDKQTTKQGTPKITASRRKNELFGKASGDSRYSVLFTESSDPVLEAVRQHQDVVCDNPYSNVVVADLDAIFKAQTYADLTRHGVDYLNVIYPNNDLWTLSDDMLTFEANPPRLALNAMEDLEFLSRVLKSHVGLESSVTLTKTDVTSAFFDVEEKKGKSVKKIKAHLKPGVKSIDLEIKYQLGDEVKTMPTTLAFGIHCPDRNVLSSQAERDASVYLVSWPESVLSFRYAFVFEAGGDSSLYCAVDANHVFTK